ncbi:MAG: hypothetical protein A2Z21_03945 [Candidatus Fraserbacteria bacterium RBG_16_55_9]|uniref:OmpR/PhoB-type domain-containing protein n=1 Tax=Fraserbacteria sp. (strain RBG_16_55_9) TaxID=1817864 RepID=A0A1F5UYU1_FRAXR|nr:MAG: hypothetical protein A2Z21_03945 [Candidatus Fraserbacteria bacterium RBG_16_55_9]
MFKQRLRHAVWRNRTFWRWVGAILLVTLLFDGVYLYRSSSELMIERTEQAQLLAQTVLESISREPGDDQKIRNQLQRVTFGSVHYAQFVHQGEVRVNLRSPDVMNLKLDPLERDQQQPRTERLWVDGLLLIDIIRPLPDSDGYIRLGVSLNTAFWLILKEAGSIAKVSLAIVLGLGLLLSAWFMLRSRNRVEEPHSLPPLGESSPLVMMEPKQPTVRLNGFLIDDMRKTILTDGGRSIALPPKEYSLIRLLASQPGRVFPEEEIRLALWPDDPLMTRKDTTHYIYLLRKRLKENGVSSNFIENVRGHGYKVSI